MDAPRIIDCRDDWGGRTVNDCGGSHHEEHLRVLVEDLVAPRRAIPHHSSCAAPGGGVVPRTAMWVYGRCPRSILERLDFDALADQERVGDQLKRREVNVDRPCADELGEAVVQPRIF